MFTGVRLPYAPPKSAEGEKIVTLGFLCFGKVYDGFLIPCNHCQKIDYHGKIAHDAPILHTEK